MKGKLQPSKTLYGLLALLVVVCGTSFALPSAVAKLHLYHFPLPPPVTFPVTVDPVNKIIIEDPAVEARLFREDVSLTAVAFKASDVFDAVAEAVLQTSWYQQLAAASAPRVVTLEPGYRKEQAAVAFGKALGWTKAEQELFLASSSTTPELLEGGFFPGTYLIDIGTPPETVRSIVDQRFEERILARYASSTEAIVPLQQALTIASIIERETGNIAEMRIISGIIWNRLFAGMNLQIDSTLQYARGTAKNGWWPVPRPRDKYIDSAFNTYLNPGLPPQPIANSRVTAVLAALNPKKTPCFFYFHDSRGNFHCAETYTEHVTLLKKYYGRGR